MEVEIIEHDELEVDFGDGSFVLDNDYKNIKNKPQINGVELDGNKTLEELGIQGAEEGKGLSEKNFTAEYEEKLKELENYNDEDVKKSIQSLADSLAETDKSLADKVDKEEGKGLSTNDFDDTYKKKLDGLSNYDDTKIKQEISSLADSLAETDKSLADKVDKEKGKGLSTNDFDNAYKEKLDELENYDDTAITDALTKANAKIAELQQTVALQDEQTPRRRRRRREHNSNR